MNAEELTRGIAAAFPDGPPPTRIVVHDCLECERIQADFDNRIWSDIDPATVRYHHDSLPLLSSAAYVYFLPAYLSYAVHEPIGDVAQMLLFNLERSTKQQEECEFSPHQRTAVLAVAEWIATHDDCGVDMDKLRKRWS